MDNFVITIARQYGSGGKTIGAMLAKELGINCYSREILPESADFVSDDNLFNYQAKVIRQLAETESCVIIGRCANMILKDYSNVLRVFVYGDWDFRIREASKKLSGTTKDIEKFMHKDDKRKEDFCKRFMGVDWADMTKYNLCLDNGTLGYEKCVEEIESALEILKK